MKTLAKNIYSWFKNPDESKLNISGGHKFILTGKMLLLDFLFTIPFLGLTYLIHYYVLKLEEPLFDYNPYFLLSLVVIIGPVIEELIFRFPLRYQRNYLARIVSWITGGWLAVKWNAFYKYFLYFMIISFGLIHLTNYKNSEILFFLLSPIIIGSQLMGGIVLSYSRVKLGFIWGILQHGLFNLTLIVIGLLFFHNSSLVNESTEDLKVEISELMYINKAESYYTSDEKDGLIYSIEAKHISLERLVNLLQPDGPKPYENVWVNAEISSKEGATAEEIMGVLKNEIKFE